MVTFLVSRIYSIYRFNLQDISKINEIKLYLFQYSSSTPWVDVFSSSCTYYRCHTASLIQLVTVLDILVLVYSCLKFKNTCVFEIISLLITTCWHRSKLFSNWRVPATVQDLETGYACTLPIRS